MKNEIFQNLFVLELANNHWGSLRRGKQIVKQFAGVVKKNNIKAAIKLQFRDIDNFIHKDYLTEGKGEKLADLPKRSRYIQKTAKTKLSYESFEKLIDYIRKHDCTPMATCFDEKTVDWAVKMKIPIVKVASSDINDWILLNKLAKTKKPVIISSGGAREKQLDDVIRFFTKRKIPLAVNHCVSKYPSEDDELELDQIDYLKNKYPSVTIGLSTHEYTDWCSSMHISYAKGARTWERHIDIPYPDGHEQEEVSKYCSLPEQANEWFKAFNKAVEMCGTSSAKRRIIDKKESNYLESLYRGLYLKEDMGEGSKLKLEHLYSAIPYLKEIDHITSRYYFDEDLILNKDMKKDAPLTKQDVS